jgi:hypothetical protein
MTDEDLRTLLQERVEDVTTTDLSGTAWRAGRRIRTRRRLGALAGVAAATLAVAGIAVVVDHRPETRTDEGPSTSSPTVEAPDEPDAMVQGAGVFWSPDPDEEGSLPPADSGVLPTIIDLSLDAGPMSVDDAPVERASAAFAVYDGARLDRVVLLTPEGYRWLELPAGVEPRADMLSADGTSVELPTWTYSLAKGRWTSHPASSPVWPEIPPQVADAAPYGAPRWDLRYDRSATSYGYGSSVPAAPGAVDQPATVVVTPNVGPPTILAINDPVDTGRAKGCCPVAGWIGDDTVVYESRSTDPKLIGWGVGTHDFTLVSRIVGLGHDESYVASFADLSDDYGPAPDDSAPDVTTSTDADASAQGVPVWWAPDLDDELVLPWVDGSAIPRDINLGDDVPDLADEPVDAAVAAFAEPDMRHPESVVLLTADGDLRRLDVSRLEPWDDHGVPYSVATPSMLAPDGRHLVFPQQGHLMVYDLATQQWTHLDTGEAETAYIAWWDARTLALLPEEFGGDATLIDLFGQDLGTAPWSPPTNAFQVGLAPGDAQGPWHENAAADTVQEWGSAAYVPVPDSSTYYAGPAFAAVVDGGETRALAFPELVDGPARFYETPVLVTWLDDDTVVYESRAADRDLLVAWDVGTQEFRRLAAISGSGQASFADVLRP